MADSIKIRVPATTANLGPGFDCLGMALNLFNTFTVRPGPAGSNRITGRGTCSGMSQGGSNIFFKAMRRVSRMAGRPAPRVEVDVLARVPLARGLGSSSTAIVAGALAANALLGSPFTRDELIGAMAREEGHPDNVAPALFGSLTASVMTGGDIQVHVYRPHPSWRVALLVPDYSLLTEKARAVIPKTVPLRDAVFNLSRVPMVIDALVTGDEEGLGFAVADRLHERYRKKLVRRYDAIAKAADKGGAAAVYLSGAGPTLAAFCKSPATARSVARAMLRAVSGARFSAEAMVLKPYLKGASIK